MTEAPPKPIAWAKVESSVLEAVRVLPGVVQAVRRADLSFEVSGRVQYVNVDVGDYFVQGDNLASLDPRTYRLRVRERSSELAQARSNLAEAASDYDRQKQLMEAGWAAKSTYDLALSRRDAAQSNVEMAEVRLSLALEDLEDTRLRAPYSGSLAGRLIEPSQQAEAGETVLQIQSNGGGLEVEVAFPETSIDQLKLGTEHRVSFPARPGLTLTGVVEDVGSRATDRNAFPVTLELIGAPSDLRTGITAEVAFNLTQHTPAGTEVLIPDTAFLAGANQSTLAFVFDETNGIVVARKIEVTDVTDGWAVVRDGLDAGEIVAAKGLPFLHDTQAVELLGVGVARYNQ